MIWESRTLTVVQFLIAAVVSFPAVAEDEASSSAARSCNTLAGSPLTAARAIEACRAAIAEFPNSMNIKVQLARSLASGKVYDEAVEHAQEAAAAGYGPAQYQMGLFFGNGEGVAQNYTHAAAWYRKAADQGDAQAQEALGVAYYLGRGVTRDHAVAASWSRKAAELGVVSAQYNLATQYAYGHGVPQNFTEAANWYGKAAEQGDVESQLSLGLLYYKGQGVDRDYDRAAMWFKKAANNGNCFATFNVGVVANAARVASLTARGIKEFEVDDRAGVYPAR